MNQRQPLPKDWMAVLGDIFEQPKLQELRAFLRAEKDQGKLIYPHSSLWFNAFWQTPLTKVKVVILGQDPYHGAGQAQGLSFSVPDGVAVPPSLQNIYKELQADLGVQPPHHGCLEVWAKQGVLLLNTVLTVVAGQANSHRKQGWEELTDRVLHELNALPQALVFLLWGRSAREKAPLLNASQHLVLEAPHPSPLSAHRGFLGCQHFSQANAWLEQQGRQPIQWALG